MRVRDRRRRACAKLSRPSKARFGRAQPTGTQRSVETGVSKGGSGLGQSKMLVQADEIDYDYNNARVSAVGNVQIYYSGSTLEADKVIYDQKTKRLHAEGNVRLTEPNGKVTYGEIIDLSDDFRDGFVDSLRVDTARPDPHGRRARRPQRRQFHGPAERRLHRVRSLPRRSAQAAAVAGQGGAHHPRPDRKDDLFRGRHASNSSASRWPGCRTCRRPTRR